MRFPADTQRRRGKRGAHATTASWWKGWGNLHDTLKVQRVAPGHCTGELGFSVFMERFKEHYDRAGLGAVISLP